MMAERAWSLGERSGRQENRHDYLKAVPAPLPAHHRRVDTSPDVTKMTLPTPAEAPKSGLARPAGVWPVAALIGSLI